MCCEEIQLPETAMFDVSVLAKFVSFVWWQLCTKLGSWDASKPTYPCRTLNILHFRLVKYFLHPLWWHSHKKFLIFALCLKKLSPWTKTSMWNGTASNACTVKTQQSTPSKVPPSLCIDESRAEIELLHSIWFITTDCSEQTVVPYWSLTVFILSAFICHLGESLYFQLLLHLTSASFIEMLTRYFSKNGCDKESLLFAFLFHLRELQHLSGWKQCCTNTVLIS